MSVAKIVVAVLIAAWLVAGVWVTGMSTPNVYVHGMAVGALAAVTTALILLGARGSRRRLRSAALISTALTLVVVIGVGAFLSRPKSVDENVVTADPAPTSTTAAGSSEQPPSKTAGNVLVASGAFTSLEHETKGTARVIELADGSAKLTLQGFKTDPGPDLYVYAVAGNPSNDGDVKDVINLGRLKGTDGDQQYSLPKDFDAGTYRHIYIWCKAFTVGFGRAKLAA